MKLMHIAACDRDGLRLDHHVVADSLEQAFSLWVKATDDEPESDVLGLIDDVVVILPDVAGTIYEGPARVIDRKQLETVYDRYNAQDMPTHVDLAIYKVQVETDPGSDDWINANVTGDAIEAQRDYDWRSKSTRGIQRVRLKRDHDVIAMSDDRPAAGSR